MCTFYRMRAGRVAATASDSPVYIAARSAANVKVRAPLINSQVDDVPRLVHEHIQMACTVGAKQVAVGDLCRIDVFAPEFAALAPGHLPRIDIDGAQRLGLPVEQQLEFAIAAGRVA